MQNLHPSFSEVGWQPRKTSNMELSVKTVNQFKPLAILTKIYIQDVWQDPEPASGFEKLNPNQIQIIFFKSSNL